MLTHLNPSLWTWDIGSGIWGMTQETQTIVKIIMMKVWRLDLSNVEQVENLGLDPGLALGLGPGLGLSTGLGQGSGWD